MPATDAPRRQPLLFDVETVADLTAENRAAVAALAAGRTMSAEQYGALCPPLARVVCIAWLDPTASRLGACVDATLCPEPTPPELTVEDGAGQTAVCFLTACTGEAQVLDAFGHVVERHLAQPGARLVTYNGRGFDLPVLLHRGLKHGVDSGRALLARAANENRYRPLLHLDLLEAVTFGGAAGRWPLAAYALGWGWRSPKQDMDGSQVGAAVQAGRLLEVVRYCAGDVLATAHVYRTLQPILPALPPGAP
jgi:Predicted 3'-5' exonuclease related to the exonuclease domain of PolB